MYEMRIRMGLLRFVWHQKQHMPHILMRFFSIIIEGDTKYRIFIWATYSRAMQDEIKSCKPISGIVPFLKHSCVFDGLSLRVYAIHGVSTVLRVFTACWSRPRSSVTSRLSTRWGNKWFAFAALSAIACKYTSHFFERQFQILLPVTLKDISFKLFENQTSCYICNNARRRWCQSWFII